MNCILILLALVLLVILYNNYFTTIENLENNKNSDNNQNTNNNSCLSKDPLFLSINNASQINILSKEVNKLQGLKKQVDGMDSRLNLLQKSVTDMVNKIGNQGFGTAGRNMETIKEPPPKISGLN
jgi:uncharacterized protein HemX